VFKLLQNLTGPSRIVVGVRIDDFETEGQCLQNKGMRTFLVGLLAGVGEVIEHELARA
jgi:hypothetical protein